MKTKDEKLAVIYNRTATRKENGKKLAEQENELVAFAKRRGYKPVAIHADTCSGNTHPFMRQGFKKLAKDIETIKPAALIVSDYARIGRRMECLVTTALWLELNGVELITVYSPEGGLQS